MPADTAPAPWDGRPDRYLIIKRGLYYRPEGQGYTAVKANAGRYTRANAEMIASFFEGEAPKEDYGFIHEDDAPEYCRACWDDVKAAHQKEVIANLRAELAEHHQRTLAASAAAWIAAREAGAKAGYDAVNWCRNEAETDLRTVREIVDDRIRALTPPEDAMAALAEVVRKAVEEEREACAEMFDDDRVMVFGTHVAAAIRARGEGGE